MPSTIPRHAASIASLLLAVAMLAGGGGCTRKQQDLAPAGSTTSAASAPVPQQGALATATRVLEAFGANDGPRLAAFAHPVLGVRFSPYAFVDVPRDRVLDRSELKALWTDERTHTWGSFDGSGDPIQMTSAVYVDRFVMDRDFSAATVITVNNRRARGNTADNSAEVYPRGTIVEYYVEPTEGQSEMNWAALRLVFEQHEGEWKLVGVIHDEWTI